MATDECLVCLSRSFTRTFGVESHNCVELGVNLSDPFQVVVKELSARYLAVANGIDQLDGSAER